MNGLHPFWIILRIPITESADMKIYQIDSAEVVGTSAHRNGPLSQACVDKAGRRGSAAAGPYDNRSSQAERWR